MTRGSTILPDPHPGATHRVDPGPAILGYDGSPTAAYAIDRAAFQLGEGREAIVVCVWRPCDVGFTPVDGVRLRTAAANEVRRAADETSARGVEIARRAGFDARARTIREAPTWRGLIRVASEFESRLIVVGSRPRPGLFGSFVGGVAARTATHFSDTVLIVRPPETR